MINKYLKSNYQNKLNSMLSPRRVEPILVIKLYIYDRLTVSLILCLVPSRLIGPLNRLGTFENFVILFLSFFGKESLDLNYIITLNSCYILTNEKNKFYGLMKMKGVPDVLLKILIKSLII